MAEPSEAWAPWDDCDYSAAAVERVLAAGASPNARNRLGFTPLIFAAQVQDRRAVELLLAAGADVAVAGLDGRTPLLVAASKGATEIVAALLAAEADPNVWADRGWTPLMMAARAGASAVVERLLAAGADVHALDDSGWSALISAAVSGDLECVRRLVEAGAKLDVRADDDLSALAVALDSGHETVARYLRERGVEPSATELLLEALVAKDPEAARRAIAQGADLTSYLFVLKAVDGRDLPLLEVLLAAGAPFDDEDDDGERPIVYAARIGQVAMVEALAKAGAELQGDALQAAAANASWSELVNLLAGDFARRAED